MVSLAQKRMLSDAVPHQKGRAHEDARQAMASTAVQHYRRVSARVSDRSVDVQAREDNAGGDMAERPVELQEGRREVGRPDPRPVL